ncbi:MAG: glutathione binding-like protein, partial [Gallionella sp.]
GCSPLFNPKLNDEGRAALMSRLTQRIAFAADALKNRKYLMGHFTVADAYLFTVLRWAPRLGIDLSNWLALKDFMERMAERPAVKTAMQEEGL